MRFIAIIPARYGSSRFPGKPLALLDGKPIIQHVYERAKRVFAYVFVATDDERIRQTVENFGGRAVMTRSDHRSGTDRCFEAYQAVCGDVEGTHPGSLAVTRIDDIVVNIQGDEPFIAPEQLQAIQACFTENPDTEIATLVKPFPGNTAFEELCNPNSPKVVVSAAGNAMYFSRSVIPYLRGVPQEEWAQRHTFFKHIGLYAYRAITLARLVQMPMGELESCESLEQLRWLQAGYSIKVRETSQETIGIDTPEDLERAEAFLQSQNL
ncbi:MAG: 3-deoxy-manno-octulosonate cytidylyltransferase [Alloprevotella sp.]|nr:3-deoxy-manno-octulosonate cytidylyltransferase [Alloprevotella sp.]MBR1652247.1 3-deoxy-manno-octulosonate cytidylyltransferase [Alloprevotella sp.]